MTTDAAIGATAAPDIASPALRVASYNVLADAYLDPRWYAHVDPAVLLPAARREALLARLVGLAADVLCLQEVEPPCFAVLRERLEEYGYAGVYAPKGRGRADGCALLMRHAAATLCRWEAFPFRDGKGTEADSGHLALIGELDTPLGPVTVASTHLRWAPDDNAASDHIGWRQVRHLLEERAGAAPRRWILAGDLNGTVDSAPIRELLAQGWIDAYGTAPQPTCNPNRRSKRIDYLFHTPDLRATPDPLPAIEDTTPLPSRDEPSDHLPIVACIRV